MLHILFYAKGPNEHRSTPLNLICLSHDFVLFIELCFTASIIFAHIVNNRMLQEDVFFSSDDIFSHAGEGRAPFRPPVRKTMALFSGKRNPNDNHYSRPKN